MTGRDRTRATARRRRGPISAIAAYTVAAIGIVLTLLPLYWLFVISTKTPAEAFKTPPDLLYVPDFSKYISIWQTADFGRAFTNSLIVVVLGVVLALLVATPAAYALVRFRVRGGRFVRLWLVVAYSSPEFLVIIPMYVLYQQIGLFDTQIGLAIIYQLFALPFAVWLLQSFFSEVPAELGDAARIDGCSHLGALLRVYLPLAAPGIAATAILVGVNIWNEITIALSLTFDQSKTVQVAVADYRGYGAIQWQEMAAAAMTAVIPMVVFAGIAQRYLVKGLTLGAVK
jgi:ABC-type glycerol-3-phosphate transport system permease component